MVTTQIPAVGHSITLPLAQRTLHQAYNAPFAKYPDNRGLRKTWSSAGMATIKLDSRAR